MKVIEQGKIEGEFYGFKDDMTVFKFSWGGLWQQTEQKNCFYYEFMPEAMVLEEQGEYYLQVGNMKERVRVKRI